MSGNENNDTTQNANINTLPHEEDVEAIANSRTGLLSYFRVARIEFKKFFLVAAMFGIICFIYSFMRIMKDMFIMMRQDPMTILFIKIFYVMPISMGLVALIQYLLNTKSISTIFSIFIIGFITLFFAFGSILLIEQKVMPSRFFLRDYLADGKFSTRGLGFLKPFLLTVNEPLATLIFISAEMYGSLLMAYLFLSFLNESCTVGQFSRFIPSLYIVANIALLCSALITEVFLRARAHLSFKNNQYMLSGVFFIEGLLTFLLLIIKRYLESNVFNKAIFIPAQTVKQKKVKASTGFADGLKIMGKSKLLLAMSLMVGIYNITFNMIETNFKSGVKVCAIKTNKNPGDMSGNFNKIDQFMTASSVIFLNLSAFSTLIETRGWLIMSSLTPITMLFSVILFLGSTIVNTCIDGTSLSFIPKLELAKLPFYTFESYCGIIFLSLLKVFKYASFDICKEKMGMRIDPQHRAKFKSVYDGIFNKLGKSIGSLYGLAMYTILETKDIRKAAPITAAVIIVFLFIWAKCLVYLSKSYQKSIHSNKCVEIDMFEEEKIK